MAIKLKRGETTSIPFAITDAALGLTGKRVTWALQATGAVNVFLRKASGLPGSTADVTITTQTAGSIVGTINIGRDDLDSFPISRNPHNATLWTDDGVTTDRVATENGTESVIIIETVSRT